MVDLKSLSGPERLIVERLVLEEPACVINAWLTFNGFRASTDEGINGIRLKFNELIVQLRASKSQDFVLKELDTIRDKLVKMSSDSTEAKDLAQLSNALNAVSKTINDYIEKKKGIEESGIVDVAEYIETLLFLEKNEYIVINKERLDELRSRLFDPVSEE